MANRWINFTTAEQQELLGILETLKYNNRVGKSILKKLTNAKKTISVSSRKGKGRGLQMWVCRAIADLLKIPFENQNVNCPIHCREMGQAGTDIILRGDAFKQFPFSIECKNTESLNLQDTIDQAKRNNAPGGDWLIVHKRKALPSPIVILEWHALIAWIKKARAK